jgi:hypothetical protein
MFSLIILYNVNINNIIIRKIYDKILENRLLKTIFTSFLLYNLKNKVGKI